MKTVIIYESGKQDLELPVNNADEVAAVVEKLNTANIDYVYVIEDDVLTDKKIFATLKLTIMAVLNQSAFYLVFNRSSKDLDESIKHELSELGWNLTSYSSWLSGTYVKYGTDALGLWKEEEALCFYSDLEPLISRIPIVEHKTALPFPFNMF